MARDPTPTWGFALCVVRKGDRFLLVHEKKHGQMWFLPAGRVEKDETFAEAAVRETLEESGVPVELEGILEIQHTPLGGAARLRVFYVARPTDDTPPLSEPNAHSLEARWVTRADLDTLPLRSVEVRQRLGAVAAGAPGYPLDLMGFEGQGR